MVLALTLARNRLAHRDGGPALDAEAAAFLDSSGAVLGLSLRGLTRCAGVARTIAALDNTRSVTVAQVREALEYRREALASGEADA